MERAGELDGLVANAALPASGRLESFSSEEVQRALRVNFESPILMARALSPKLAEKGEGHIVFIASLAGKVGSPRSSLYNATKFGLRGFAFGLREDLHPHGVGVSVVSPGFVREAGMFHDARSKPPPGSGTTTPKKVAEAVVRAIRSEPQRDHGGADATAPRRRVRLPPSRVRGAGAAPRRRRPDRRGLGGRPVGQAIGSFARQGLASVRLGTRRGTNQERNHAEAVAVVGGCRIAARSRLARTRRSRASLTVSDLQQVGQQTECGDDTAARDRPEHAPSPGTEPRSTSTSPSQPTRARPPTATTR